MNILPLVEPKNQLKVDPQQYDSNLNLHEVRNNNDDDMEDRQEDKLKTLTDNWMSMQAAKVSPVLCIKTIEKENLTVVDVPDPPRCNTSGEHADSLLHIPDECLLAPMLQLPAPIVVNVSTVRHRISKKTTSMNTIKKKKSPVQKMSPFSKLGFSRLIDPLYELGASHHSMMLRQLRYVKSVMHELPWARGALKHMLLRYTDKEISKEEMYPKLYHLSFHVHSTLSEHHAQVQEDVARRNRMSLQLAIAQDVVTSMTITKYGRLGAPHTTKLMYNATNPLNLHWRSKNGDKSCKSIRLDHTTSIDRGASTPILIRAQRKFKADPDCCISIKTGTRNLDISFASSLEREWMINALQPIVAFSKQCLLVESKRNRLRRY